MKFAIMGLGGRGDVYSHFIKEYGHDIVAVCDPSADRRKYATDKYGVEAENLYADENEFFAKGKLADALVISTLDPLHYRQTIKALDLGYDILLEKPIAMTLRECEEIRDKAIALNRKVVICHVARYSPFFCTIKKLLKEGAIGDIVSINMCEEIGYYHFAHSYVRGPWRNTDISTPLILAKNCHDIDMICWLIGEKCISVSSVGGLKHFREENAPKGSTSHCFTCPHKDTCKYSCFYIYNNAEYEKIAGLARHGRLGATKEQIDKSLSDPNNLYARCVYRCDNNVCDHQTVNMIFDKQITAQFLSVAFSNDMPRLIKIYGTEGMLYRTESGDIEVEKLNGKKQFIKIEYPTGGYAHHAGGDVGIVKQFVDYVEKGVSAENITDIATSVMGHKIAFLAEESRLENGKTYYL